MFVQKTVWFYKRHSKKCFNSCQLSTWLRSLLQELSILLDTVCTFLKLSQTLPVNYHTKCLIHARDNPVFDFFTISIPTGPIFLLAQVTVSPFSMYQQDEEVDRVEVWQDTGESWKQQDFPIITYKLWRISDTNKRFFY